MENFVQPNNQVNRHCNEVRDAPFFVQLCRWIVQLMPRGRYWMIRKLSHWTKQTKPFIGVFDKPALRLHVVPSELVSRHVYFYGFHEREVTATFLHLLRPGFTILDVGANFGYFTLLAANRLRATGTIIAFEPEPKNRDWLEQNLNMNGFDRVKVSDRAISSGTGILQFDTKDGSGNRGKASTITNQVDQNLVQVQSVGLDEYCDKVSITHVDIIKIDIEGGESAAVEGMSEGIKNARYHRVFLEIHPEMLEQAGRSVASVFTPFKKYGYRCWRLVEGSTSWHRHYSIAFTPDMINECNWPNDLQGNPQQFLLTAPNIELSINDK